MIRIHSTGLVGSSEMDRLGRPQLGQMQSVGCETSQISMQLVECNHQYQLLGSVSCNIGVKHVFFPLLTKEALGAIRPHLDALIDLSRTLDIESVAVFTLDTADPDRHRRGKDLCPAIGVPEEAASGTTNGAIASYLVTHGRIPVDNNASVTIVAEQGLDMGRPSIIHTEIKVEGIVITSVKVGGSATRLVSGNLTLP